MRAFIPSGTPMLAVTATVTKKMRIDVCSKLEMSACKFVYASPEWPNIYYNVLHRSEMEVDLKHIVDELLLNRNRMPRIIIYCRSLNLCADLYAFFLTSLGEDSYYPPGAAKISDNRVFGMYHANTPPHNKEVILSSMEKADGIVRVVFATVALGMGVNFVGLNKIIHYGAPSSIDDYYQESGRAGRSGEAAKSTIYWKPCDAPLKKDLSNPRNAELAAVRQYLENDKECRRRQLLNYFDHDLFSSVLCHDKLLCCDVCAKTVIKDGSTIE